MLNSSNFMGRRNKLGLCLSSSSHIFISLSAALSAQIPNGLAAYTKKNSGTRRHLPCAPMVMEQWRQEDMAATSWMPRNMVATFLIRHEEKGGCGNICLIFVSENTHQLLSTVLLQGGGATDERTRQQGNGGEGSGLNTDVNRGGSGD